VPEVIVSIGTGRVDHKAITERKGLFKKLPYLLEVAEASLHLTTHSEKINNEVMENLEDNVTRLFRFNVVDGALGKTELDEAKALGDIAAATDSYLAEPTTRASLNRCVERIASLGTVNALENSLV